MAENSRFGKLSTSTMQEIIDNAILQATKSHKMSKLTQLLGV